MSHYTPLIYRSVPPHGCIQNAGVSFTEDRKRVTIMDPQAIKLAAAGVALLALVLSLLNLRHIAHAPAAPPSLVSPSAAVTPAR